ncbi:MAG: hypothetical protein IT299_06730 [Dehalococcoidia bacterium]|nr:hypothetical protein [Dehalococcoidia bacterium]
MALGPFSEADPLDAARIAAEAAAEPAARLRAQRAEHPPPIWVDRPRGSYRGAALLGALCVLGTALLLYDLELVWRAAPVRTEGRITFAAPMRGVDGWYWFAVRYDSAEALLMVAKSNRPYVGDPVTVMTHTRYFRAHVHSVLSPSAAPDRPPYFVEPPHTLGINGLIGAVGAVLSGVLATVQWRLARSQARRTRDWLDGRTSR